MTTPETRSLHVLFAMGALLAGAPLLCADETPPKQADEGRTSWSVKTPSDPTTSVKTTSPRRMRDPIVSYCAKEIKSRYFESLSSPCTIGDPWSEST